MKIARAAKREATVELGDKKYLFTKDKDGQYTAEVDDESHARRLLSISGYTQVTEKGERALKVQKTDTPAPDEDEDDTDAAEELFKELQQRNDIETSARFPDGDPGADDEGDDGEGEGDADGNGGNDEATDRDKLVEAYQAKFGKKPHARLSAEKIQQALDAE